MLSLGPTVYHQAFYTTSLIRAAMGLSPNNESNDNALIVDSGKNAINATAYSGKALSFDGTNDFVDTGSPLTFERTDTFEFEGWIYENTSASTQTVFGTLDPDTNFRGFQIRVNADNTVRFVLIHATANNKIRVDSSLILEDGKWSKLKITYDGSSNASGVVIFINDVEDDSLNVLDDNLSDTAQSAKNAVFGSLVDQSGDFFNGKISYPKITINDTVVRHYKNLKGIDNSNIWFDAGSDKAHATVNGATVETGLSGLENGETHNGIPQSVNEEWNSYPQPHNQGDNAYYGGGAINNKVVLAPWNANQIAIVDTTDDSVTYITHSQGDSAYAGAAAINNKVVLAAHDASQIAIIDTTDDSVTYITHNQGIDAYIGAAAINNKVVLAPYNADQIAIVDTTDDSVTYITHNQGDAAYAGAAAINNKVVLAAFNANQIAIIDTTDDSVTYITHNQGFYAYIGAAAINNKVVLAPYNADNIAIVDTTDNSVTYITHNQGNNAYRGAAAINNKVVLAAYDASQIAIVDTTDDSVTYITHNQGIDAYREAAAINNKVVLAAWNANQIAVVDTTNDLVYYYAGQACPEDLSNPGFDIFGNAIQHSIKDSLGNQVLWNFDGESWIDTNWVRTKDRDKSFTLLVAIKPLVIGSSNTMAVFENYNNSIKRGVNPLVIRQQVNKLVIALYNSASNPVNSIVQGFSKTYITPVLNILMAIYNGSSDVDGLKLYQDGAELTQIPSENSLSNTVVSGLSFLIGKRHNNTNWFEGQISQIQFFEKDLSSKASQKYQELFDILNA